jgi:hypothetical protein
LRESNLRVAMTSELISGDEQFTTADMAALSQCVVAAWTMAVDRDWTVPAGTLDWSCLQTADHAVDCVYAPTFFLASRRLDSYPDMGSGLVMGDAAAPAGLIESLQIASRLLVALINDTDPAVRAVIFRFPEILVAPPADFAPRAATELILHAHDVCSGLGVAFEPDAALCGRLREHTRPWPMWTVAWHGLAESDDPWADLLTSSGRSRYVVS